MIIVQYIALHRNSYMINNNYISCNIIIIINILALTMFKILKGGGHGEEFTGVKY